jgi:hypothetical protein
MHPAAIRAIIRRRRQKRLKACNVAKPSDEPVQVVSLSDDDNNSKRLVGWTPVSATMIVCASGYEEWLSDKTQWTMRTGEHAGYMSYSRDIAVREGVYLEQQPEPGTDGPIIVTKLPESSWPCSRKELLRLVSRADRARRMRYLVQDSPTHTYTTFEGDAKIPVTLWIRPPPSNNAPVPA